MCLTTDPEFRVCPDAPDATPVQRCYRDAYFRRDPRAVLCRIEACKRTAMAAQATIIRSDPRLGATMLAAAKLGAGRAPPRWRAALGPFSIAAEADVAGGIH
jgi:hypothetical protein